MMKKEVKIDPLIQEVMGGYSKRFDPFFVSRVMGKIEGLSGHLSSSGIYDLFFKRMMLSGAVAVAAMVIITVLLNGGLSVDGLLGIGDLELEKAIAMSITDY